MAEITITNLNGHEEKIATEDVYTEMVYNKASNEDVKHTVEEIVAYQNSMQEKGKYAEALKWDETVTLLVGLYTSNSKFALYAKLLKSENPMLEAVKVMTYDTIKVSSSTDKKTRVTTQKVNESMVPIDLLDFEKNARENHQVNIGHSRTWKNLIERLNYIYTIRAGRELGDPKYDARNLKNLHDNYVMSKVARELEVNEGDISKPQLLSNRQLLRELNGIGRAMLGPEFKFNSHDVAALYGSYKGNLQIGKSKDGKYAKISVPSTRKFVERIMIACNRVINDGRYHVESSQFKKEK